MLITEADVIYRYLAGNIPLYRMLGLLHIPLLVDYLIYPDDRDGNIYELAQKAREPKQRRVEHRNIRGYLLHISESHITAQNTASHIPQNKELARAHEELQYRHDHTVPPIGDQLHIAFLCHIALISNRFRALSAVGFYDTDAGKDIVHHRRSIRRSYP